MEIVQADVTDGSSTYPNSVVHNTREESAPLGLFGWETIDSVPIPYIFRGSSKLVCTTIVLDKIFKKYDQFFTEEVTRCFGLKKMQATQPEADLLNEINENHSDLEYGTKKFSVNDRFLLLEDCRELKNFLDFCIKILVLEIKKGCKRCGFFRIEKNLVPFVKTKSKFYVPLFYFDGYNSHLEELSLTIDSWDLVYMKFCCAMHNINKNLYSDDKCKVIAFDEILKLFPEDVKVEKCWPQNINPNLLLKPPNSSNEESKAADGDIETVLVSHFLFKPPNSSNQEPKKADRDTENVLVSPHPVPREKVEKCWPQKTNPNLLSKPPNSNQQLKKADRDTQNVLISPHPVPLEKVEKCWPQKTNPNVSLKPPNSSNQELKKADRDTQNVLVQSVAGTRPMYGYAQQPTSNAYNGGFYPQSAERSWWPAPHNNTVNSGQQMYCPNVPTSQPMCVNTQIQNGTNNKQQFDRPIQYPGYYSMQSNVQMRDSTNQTVPARMQPHYSHSGPYNNYPGHVYYGRPPVPPYQPYSNGYVPSIN